MNQKNTLVVIVLVIILIVLGALIFIPLSPTPENTLGETSGEASTSTNTILPVTDSNAPLVYDQSVSDGTIKLSYPNSQFGLAVNQAQVLVVSYIPPCDPDFNYCLYQKTKEYQGTNFESAGIRVKKRTDLQNENVCLTTAPKGFSSSVKPNTTTGGANYSSSIFKGISDAGAGHVATGDLSRLFIRVSASCYEFQTRVGKTQFANYPAGTIKEFTATDEANVVAKLDDVMSRITLATGESNLFKAK